MKLLLCVLTLSLAALAPCAFAADAAGAVGDCDTQAAAKHLGGAAKTSFLKKCNKDAAAAAAAASSPASVCAAKAAEKHLAGAAKASFTKKCEADAAAAAK